MLEIFNKISIDELNNFILGKNTKQSSKNDKIELKSNILFFEYSKEGFHLKNLSDCYNDNNEFNIEKLLSNIKGIKYLSELSNELNSIKEKNDLEYTKNIIDYLSPNNIFRFQYKDKNGKSYNIDGLQTGNNSIGGAGGPNFWISQSGYFAAKKNEDILKLKNNVFKNYIEWFSKNITEKNIKENIKIKINFEIMFKNNLNYDLFLNELNVFNENVLKDKENIDFEIKNVFETLNYEKPTIIICDFFNLYKNFTINDLQSNLFEYYNSVFNFFEEETTIKINTCKSCNSKNDLSINKKYSENRGELTHIFNLDKNKNKDKNYDNFSFYICQECNNKLNEVNKYIKSNKIYFIKIQQDNLRNKIKLISNLSEFVKNSEEVINSSTIYKIQVDDMNGEFDFKEYLNIKKNKTNTVFNFNVLQQMLSMNTISKDNEKYIENWVDLLNSDNKEKKEKIIYIQKNKTNFINFWLYDVKFEYKTLNDLLNYYLKSLNKKDNKVNEIFKIFKFSKIENNKFIYLSNKDLLNNSKVHTVVDFILKRKENTMFEKHKSLNEKLSLLNDKVNELDLEEFDLSDNEFWLLYGNVLSYLYSKSKESEKTLDYLTFLKNINSNMLIKNLQSLFLKYGHEINFNQFKFKLIYSILIDDLTLNKRIINDETLSFILSGALNNNVISLTKSEK